MILATDLSAQTTVRTAIALLNHQLNTQNTQKTLLPVGMFVAQGDANNWATQRVSADTYYFLLAAEGMGLLSIEKLPREDGAAASPHGFSQRITVALTGKGRALNQWKRSPQSQANSLAIRISTTNVQRIVSNTEITKAAGNFRMIAFTATEALDASYVELITRKYAIERQAGGPCHNCDTPMIQPAQRKHRILLKRSASGDGWQMVALDSAGSNEDFRTDYVNAYLKKLKR